MRTSRVSQDTSKLFSALASSSGPTSTKTRASRRAIRSFASGRVNDSDADQDQHDQGDLNLEQDFPLATPISTDIEDALSTRASSRSSRKRKRGAVSPVTTITSTVTESTTTWTPRRSQRSRARPEIKTEEEVKDEDEETKHEDLHEEDQTSPSGAKVKAKPKIPARKTTAEDGTVTIHPPSNWEAIYEIIRKMRERNPIAPVDTMGCEDLYWRSSPAKEKRYHTLTALMLSSQTKDTVTAAAMQRLHTELVPRPIAPADSKETSPSSLTISNILACSPEHLDNLIGKVGFHNNKTRYIKQTAQILSDKFSSDIPSTITGLISLPGVGPKMAYLCLSAAWGITEGIGVDVHVHRITNMWGWHKTKNPEETRAWLEGWLPREKWHHINKMLVGLGQTVCLPVGRRCWECDLQGTGLCKGEVRGYKVKEEKRRVKGEKKEEGVDIVKEEKKVKVKEELVDE